LFDSHPTVEIGLVKQNCQKKFLQNNCISYFQPWSKQ